MFESKYGKVLTVILVVVIVAIIGLLGFLAYQWYDKYTKDKDAGDFVSEFNGNPDDTELNDGDLQGVADVTADGSSKKTYKGFVVLGTIEIPKTDVKYPILAKVTKKSIEVAVAYLYGPGVNQPGNSVIIGHNYRNGQFFSDNAKLENGDKIYITDNNGNKVTYTIYNKFQTTPEDTSFYQRDTNGVPEVTLSTCTDDSKNRIIIEARAE